MEFRCGVNAREARRLFFLLLAVELGLAAIYLGDVLLRHPSATLHRLFDLDGEGNIPAWFSAVQLSAVSLLAFLIGRSTGGESRPSRRIFFVMSAAFLFLSMDEAAAIHESIGRIQNYVSWMPHFKGGHGIWIFIYLLIGSGVVFSVSRDIAAMWSLHRRPAILILAGGAIFLSGAVVLEVLGYQYLRSGSTPMLYQIEVLFEEFFEMSGVTVMLYGTLILTA